MKQQMEWRRRRLVVFQNPNETPGAELALDQPGRQAGDTRALLSRKHERIKTVDPEPWRYRNPEF
jgi:hypothetical protein